MCVVFANNKQHVKTFRQNDSTKRKWLSIKNCLRKWAPEHSLSQQLWWMSKKGPKSCQRIRFWVGFIFVYYPALLSFCWKIINNFFAGSRLFSRETVVYLLRFSVGVGGLLAIIAFIYIQGMKCRLNHFPNAHSN